MILFRHEIAILFLQRGKFDLENSHQTASALGLFLFGFFAASFFAASPSEQMEFQPSEEAVVFSGRVYSSGLANRMFFDTAYTKAASHPLKAPANIRAIVSPHHLLVADRVAALFSSVASKRVQTVIVLSPNHFSRGRAPIVLSEGAWATPYGPVLSDAGTARYVVSRDLV